MRLRSSCTSLTTTLCSLFLLGSVAAALDDESYYGFARYMVNNVGVEKFCEVCPNILNDLKTDPDQVVKRAYELCESDQNFPTRFCDAEFKIYRDSVLKIVKGLKAPVEDVCKFLARGECGPPQSEQFNWDIKLDGIADDAEFSDEHHDHHPHHLKTHLAFLHITDTHFDEDYEIGADANCKDPICCTKYQNQTKELQAFAGPWGHPFGKPCDIPLRTVENMFQNVQQKKKVDYAIWTGDISSHGYLGASKERAMHDLQKTTALFKRYLYNIKVYPAIGNHDSYPDRLFPQPGVDAGNFSVTPLYEEMWNLWYEWLPQDQEDIFKYGGYYTALIREGMRIISLNTNFCYTGNWWLVLGANDPAGQLKWLIETLEKARMHQEKVHIIGHVPPGSSACHYMWEEAYYKIITQYRRTITGQFYAHMHHDSVILDYSDLHNHENPTSVMYVSPTVTTSWSGMPEYRVYHTEKGLIADIETYFLNLTKANADYIAQRDWLHEKVRKDKQTRRRDQFHQRAMEQVIYGQPTWEFAYSAKKTYQLRDFTPESWHKLTKSLESDEALFQTYYKHRVQLREDVVDKEAPCDEKCKGKTLADLVSQRTHRARKHAKESSAHATTASTQERTAHATTASTQERRK